MIPGFANINYRCTFHLQLSSKSHAVLCCWFASLKLTKSAALQNTPHLLYHSYRPSPLPSARCRLVSGDLSVLYIHRWASPLIR